VVPIFRGDAAGQSESYGTGFLVANTTGSFLVSAAHVFDPLKSGHNLFFYVGHDRVHNLSGSIRLTTPSEGKADRLDIGVLRLEDAASPPYPQVNKQALPIDALMPAALPREKKHYFVTGFPVSKTQPHFVRQRIDSAPYGNWTTSAPRAAYERVDCSEPTHIVMPFNPKKVIGPHLETRAFPSPVGMSGSPVWLMYDQVETNNPIQTPVVGVLIEYHRRHRLLVAIDIKVALDMINGFSG